MSDNKKFNQNKYVQQYIKDHYIECKVRLKADNSDKISAFCAARGISKNTLFTDSALYVIENNIDLWRR